MESRRESAPQDGQCRSRRPELSQAAPLELGAGSPAKTLKPGTALTANRWLALARESPAPQLVLSNCAARAAIEVRRCLTGGRGR